MSGVQIVWVMENDENLMSHVLPSPYTESFQALSVNAFRWRIRDGRPGEMPGDA